MKKAILITMLMALILSVSISAQTLATQGVLRDSDGHSVADGSYEMTFQIYDSETGGTLIWGPQTKNVAVVNGIYNVILGETSPLNTLNSDGANWLEIVMNTETMTPRLKLNVSAYELAVVSGGSNAIPLSGNVGIGTTNPHAMLSIVKPGDNNDLIQFDEDSDDIVEFSFQGLFSGTGDANNKIKFRSAWKDKIMVWLGNGNVGIGTETPSSPLEVVGNIRSSGRIGNIGNNAGQDMERGDESLTTLRYDADNYRIFAGGPGGAGEVVTVNETGKVGIGISTPETKLNVAGYISDVAVGSGGTFMIGSSGNVNLAMDNNEIMARNNGQTATLYLNNDGGDVVTGGDFKIKNGSTVEKPFRFEKYTGYGENCYIETNMSSDIWVAAIVGFDAGDGDIDEIGVNDLWQINAFVENGVWRIFCDAPTHNDYPNWDIYVMFVSKKMATMSTAYGQN